MVNLCKYYGARTKSCKLHTRCIQGDRDPEHIEDCPEYAASPCECTQDGFCEKFKRQMVGRMREMCRGENIDAGQAEHFRQFWLSQANGQPIPVSPITTKCPSLGLPVIGEKRICGGCGPGVERQVFNCEHLAKKSLQITLEDCHTCEYAPRPEGIPILLKNTHLSPGDVLVMTAAIRSLHLAHPGKYSVAVETNANAIFEFSPDVAPVTGQEIQMHYPAINQCNERSIHFMQAYCEFLGSVLGVTVPLLTNRPHIWLSKEEKSWINQTGSNKPFWLINSGVKNNFTAKQYPYYQEVVDRLQGKVLFVQVGKTEHTHVPLQGVINLLDKTDDRQLIRLVYHCSGVLCSTTFLMHLAAAFEKPAVIIAGGREPRSWNTYPMQTLLSTVGMLSCCEKKACWKSRTVKLNDGSDQDHSLCEQPTLTDLLTPQCMTMIRPKEVAEKVLLHGRFASSTPRE